MAEVHLQDFTLLESIESTDIFNVQRLSGVWKNYKTSIAGVTGIAPTIYEEEFTFAEISPNNPAIEILPDPGAGNVYLITNAWARYNGTGFDANAPQVVVVRLIWFEQNQSFSGVLRTHTQGHAAAMYWEFGTTNYAIDRNVRINCSVYPGGTEPLGTGTITVHLEYALVAL